jgi:hypothetical protein
MSLEEVKTMYSQKKILAYGGTGVVVAVLMIAALVSPTLFPVEAKTGTLIVKVTDSPVPDLQHLNLTINKVEVSNETGNWVNLPISGGSLYFDLLKLQNVTKDLAIGNMPVGNYTKIRMQIITANATLSDGTTMTLNVPPNHIDIQVHFEIKPGKTTSLLIDIVVDKIQIAERGHSGNPANLNPQFKAITIPPP